VNSFVFFWSATHPQEINTMPMKTTEQQQNHSSTIHSCLNHLGLNTHRRAVVTQHTPSSLFLLRLALLLQLECVIMIIVLFRKKVSSTTCACAPAAALHPCAWDESSAPGFRQTVG
jgi:hypothetical protein